MLLLFGMARKRHLVGMYNLFCPVCNHPGVHMGIVEKRAFSFFFIPLIPLGSGKKLKCERCSKESNTKTFPAEYEIPVELLLAHPLPPRMAAVPPTYAYPQTPPPQPPPYQQPPGHSFPSQQQQHHETRGRNFPPPPEDKTGYAVSTKPEPPRPPERIYAKKTKIPAPDEDKK